MVVIVAGADAVVVTVVVPGRLSGSDSGRGRCSGSAR